MFKSKNISRKDKLRQIFRLLLPVIYYLPFVKVLGTVQLQALENLLGILSSHWTHGSVLGWLGIYLLLF